MVPMSNIPPGDEPTIGQLLDTLRDRIVSVIQDKPADLTLDKARTFEQSIGDVLIHARWLVNSFCIAARTPPELLGMISSYLTEEDLFSASQVCHYWRSVLTSFPSLWTRVSCRSAPRGIASLERCGSLPIELRFEPSFLHVALKNAVLEGILLRENKITSLTINHRPNVIPQLRQLFMHAKPSVEKLHIYAGNLRGWRAEEQPAHEVWQDLPSLRELFISRYCIPIEKLNAPNLIHLALESTGNGPNVTIRSILDMLRGCPSLETLLLDHCDVLPGGGRDHPSVSLPRLRSIEVGVVEVHFGMIPYLDLPQNVKAGFRGMRLSDLCADTSHPVMAAMQHVLGKLDILYVTLVAPPPPHSCRAVQLLICFEGLQGSLEITVEAPRNRTQPRDLLFGPDGVLSSHSHHIKNVTELRIMSYHFDGQEELHHIDTVMPNIVSVSFSNCDGPHILKLLAPTHLPSPSFPRLERLMVLGPELELEEMAGRRKDLGAPLKTLVVGQGLKGLEFDRLEDYTVLGDLVEDLRIGCPTEIVEWGTRNEIRNFWSPIKELYVTSGQYGAFKFCRFDVS